MATLKGREIKLVVQEHYSTLAREAIAACGPEGSEASCQCGHSDIYADSDLGNLTLETVAASDGCGNPTALADLKPGETVLDLGSGGGIDCFMAAQAVGPGGSVLGIDMTPDMVDLARSNAQKMGVINVKFHLGEIEALPFKSNIVDVVISNCVVCLSPDKDAVFKEAFRVLRPGGRLHLSDMALSGQLPQDIADDPQQWAGCVSGAELKETYITRLTAAGFENITIENEGSYTPEAGQKHYLSSVRVRAIKPALDELSR